MARIHVIRTSRKPHQCSHLSGHEIPAGDGYQWAAPGYHAPKRIRCLNHPFRQSELISGLASEPTRAREDFEASLDSIDPTAAEALEEITSALEEFASAVGEYRDARQESLDAWENGNSTLEELLDTAEQAASEAESYEVDEWDWTLEDDDEGDPKDARDDEDHPQHEAALDAWTTHVEDQLDEARDMASSLEF